MKQQFVVTHRYTILQETQKTWTILNRPTLKRVVFIRTYKDKNFCLWTQHFDRRCVCNYLVMQKSQFDEFCGLWQIVVSWVSYSTLGTQQETRKRQDFLRAPQQMLRAHCSLEGLLCNPVIKMIFLFVFPSNGAPVEWNWQGKTEVLGWKTCPSATLSTTNTTWTDPG
jgi:hypothetical protein